jgi:hypothetical protein
VPHSISIQNRRASGGCCTCWSHRRYGGEADGAKASSSNVHAQEAAGRGRSPRVRVPPSYSCSHDAAPGPVNRPVRAFLCLPACLPAPLETGLLTRPSLHNPFLPSHTLGHQLLLLLLLRPPPPPLPRRPSCDRPWDGWEEPTAEVRPPSSARGGGCRSGCSGSRHCWTRWHGPAAAAVAGGGERGCRCRCCRRWRPRAAARAAPASRRAGLGLSVSRARTKVSHAGFT